MSPRVAKFFLKDPIDYLLVREVLISRDYDDVGSFGSKEACVSLAKPGPEPDRVAFDRESVTETRGHGRKVLALSALLHD